MLDADDRAAVQIDEPVEHAREVARACADVEDARAGAQIREEELGGMCVLVGGLCAHVRGQRGFSEEERERRDAGRTMCGAEMVASCPIDLISIETDPGSV